MKIIIISIIMIIVLCSCDHTLESEMYVRTKYAKCEVVRIGPFRGNSCNEFIVVDKRSMSVRYVLCDAMFNIKPTADYVLIKASK